MKNIDFKRIALKTLKFVIIFVITDFLFGTLASKLFFNQETGKYARSTYVIKKAKEDIIVFGSSHAHRHYVPEVISEKLSKTCYNAGADGQQLVYHNVLQKMILNRYHPEIIILNIDEEFLFKSNKSIDRLGDLHPYYFDFKDELYATFKLVKQPKDPKLLLKSYQNNSTLIQAVKYYLKPKKTLNGYRPLYEKMTEQKLIAHKNTNFKKDYTKEIDSANIKILKEFINRSKQHNIKLVFFTSPNLIRKNITKNKSLNLIRQIANKESIPFYDFINNPGYLNKLDLFYDPSHLNDIGARKFTIEVCKLINQ